MLIPTLVCVGVSIVVTVIFQVYYHKLDNVNNFKSRIDLIESNTNRTLEEYSVVINELKNDIDNISYCCSQCEDCDE